MVREALWEGMRSRGWSLKNGISARLRRASKGLPTLPPREDTAEVGNWMSTSPDPAGT